MGSEMCIRDRQCSASLFRKVYSAEDHPLRELFDSRLPTPRNPCVLRRPRANTKRLSSSFVSYCPTQAHFLLFPFTVVIFVGRNLLLCNV